MQKKMKNLKRGNYGEILMSTLNSRTKKQVMNLFNEAKNADKVDEHGTWEFGAEFDKHGRGYAINWDVYGIGRDYFSKRMLVVIQIRKWEKQRKNGYANVQKSYFLLGRNEDDSAFAHAVESRVIHHAIKTGQDVCRACQNWIFGGDYTKMIRQGDIALIPMKATAHIRKAELEDRPGVVLEDSHHLTAVEIRRNGALYAKNPSIIHLPGTHPDHKNLRGWYKIVVGRRGRTHDFAAPTID